MCNNNTGQRKALLVEDNPGQMELLEKMMKSHFNNFSVVSTGDIEEAKKKIDENRDSAFDLLIIDIMLPENAETAGEIEEFEKKRQKLLIKTIAGSYDLYPELNKGNHKTFLELDQNITACLNMRGGVDIVKYYFKTVKDAETKTAVLYYTARMHPEVRKEAMESVLSKRVKYCEKPETVATIVDAINEILDI